MPAASLSVAAVVLTAWVHLAGAFPSSTSGSAPFPAHARPAGSAIAESTRAGHDLFHGQRPLAGRIRGHADALPAEALRCVNCHARQPTPAPPLGDPRISLRRSGSFGPVLDAAWVAGERSRRGAPPTTYDAARLCVALREGLDPAQVQLSRTMPLFELSDADCRGLWAYLVSPPTP